VVTTAAGKEDVLGREILSEVGRMLGIGLANLVNVFDPEIIIAGGGLAEAGELILSPAREELEKRVISLDSRRVEIVQAKLGTEAGVIGAATMALDEMGRALGCQGPGMKNSQGSRVKSQKSRVKSQGLRDEGRRTKEIKFFSFLVFIRHPTSVIRQD
jgi:hypothetical protein